MIKPALIIGKIPPPIGGVTIHVSRLLRHLSESDISYDFYDLNGFNVFSYAKAMLSTSFCHIHSSNPIFRLLSSVLALVFRKKSIITFHGNLGRYGYFKNKVDDLTLRVCANPIVLNEKSFQYALNFNRNTQLISAFLPPIKGDDLDKEIYDKVTQFIKGRTNIYCTNAYDVSFDKEGNEIYGISQLITVFSKLSDYYLIFSDPSGNYLKFLNAKEIRIPNNVHIISKPHSFIEIVKKSEGLLRTTTTDGDSLSVKEGLFYGKKVICSNCVDRPKGCEIYRTGDWNHFIEILKGVKRKEQNTNLSGYSEIKKLYIKLIEIS